METKNQILNIDDTKALAVSLPDLHSLEKRQILIGKCFDTSSLLYLFNLFQEDEVLVKEIFNVAGKVLDNKEEIKAKVFMFKKLSDNLASKNSKALSFSHFMKIEENLVSVMRDNKASVKQELLKGLVEKNYLSFSSLKDILYTIESDQILYSLLKKSENVDEAYFILKFFMEEEELSKIVESGGKIFELKSWSEEKERQVAEKAQKVLHALQKEPLIIPLKDLRDSDNVENKFVVCLDENHDVFVIAWGAYDFHKYIMNGLSNKYKTTPELTSGGRIKVDMSESVPKVRFWDKSQDYGKYNFRFLKKFKPLILESLNKQFNGSLEYNNFSIRET